MDIATILGLLVGFGFVLGGIGANLPSFIDVPSILIVIGGTFSITTVSFKLPDVINAQKVMLKTLLFKLPNVQTEAGSMIDLAQKARANGLLAIQGDVDAIEDEFLQQGLTLAVDGSNPELIERVMKSDTMHMMERHNSAIQVFRKSAEVAPAMGLIGTLIGLVIMLGSLEDPSSIGPAMAIALLTTMYGAIMANMVFSPLAAKLELNSNTEVQLRKIYTATAISIVKQENPRQLQLVVNTILPPNQRVNMFE